MNMANKSIIICDTPPTIGRRKNAADSENQTPFVLKSLKAKTSPEKTMKKVCCKRLLKGHSQRRTSPRKKRKRLDEKNLEDSRIEELIVLSDADDNEKDCLPVTCRRLRRSLRLQNVMKQNGYNQKRLISNAAANTTTTTITTTTSSCSSTATADVTCLVPSDIDDTDSQDTIKDGNAETLRNADSNQVCNDIMILWSSDNCKGADSTGNKRFGEETDERLFMVDVSPDLRNLNCLMSDSEPLAKRRKAQATTLVGRLRQNRKGQLKKSKRRWCKKVAMLQQINEDERKLTSYEQIGHNSIESPVKTSEIGVHSSLKENSNVYHLRNNVTVAAGALREIIVDGSNIAMAYTKGKTFSEHGIKLVIEYFLKRGHSVKVFVPQHTRSIEHKYLEKLYSKGIVVFTPSRKIRGKMITSYDDRFILQYATMREGVVVSLDQYRDLYMEKPEWRHTIEKRLLVPTFVDNYVMFPEDPLGRHGPKLDAFLRH